MEEREVIKTWAFVDGVDAEGNDWGELREVYAPRPLPDDHPMRQLYRARVGRRVSLRDMAERTGIPMLRISGIERGHNEPTV